MVPFIEEDHRVLEGSTGAVNWEVSAPGRKSTPRRWPSWSEPSGGNGHSPGCERQLSHCPSGSHGACFQEHHPHPDHKPVLPKAKIKNFKYRITNSIRWTLVVVQALVWTAGMAKLLFLPFVERKAARRWLEVLLPEIIPMGSKPAAFLSTVVPPIPQGAHWPFATSPPWKSSA